MSGLLLLYSSTGNKKGIAELAEKAESKAKYNVSFLCYFLLGQLDKCVEVLCKNERISEAAFFSRTYLPSKVQSWRTQTRFCYIILIIIFFLSLSLYWVVRRGKEKRNNPPLMRSSCVTLVEIVISTNTLVARR